MQQRRLRILALHLMLAGWLSCGLMCPLWALSLLGSPCTSWPPAPVPALRCSALPSSLAAVLPPAPLPSPGCCSASCRALAPACCSLLQCPPATSRAAPLAPTPPRSCRACAIRLHPRDASAPARCSMQLPSVLGGSGTGTRSAASTPLSRGRPSGASVSSSRRSRGTCAHKGDTHPGVCRGAKAAAAANAWLPVVLHHQLEELSNSPEVSRG